MTSRFNALFETLAISEHEPGAYQTVQSALRGWPRLFFIGNGGSAAIAGHMAADFMKNGGFATLCFNDAALVTCISNDLGYNNVFSLPISRHGRPGDLLFAISSSGQSDSIVQAVACAHTRGMHVITLSGFEPTNRLRAMGSVNFYLPSSEYGIVETGHHIILHSILDEAINENRTSVARCGQIRIGHPEQGSGTGAAGVRTSSAADVPWFMGGSIQGSQG